MHGKVPWKFILIAGAILLLLAGGCLWYILSTQPPSQIGTLPTLPAPREGCLNVYMLDVGQGDSLLLISPEGKTMLMDTGSEEQAQAVESSLRALGIETLDVLVLTHAHEDHAGSAIELVKRVSIGKAYLGGDTAGYEENLLKQLSRRKVETEFLWVGTEVDWSESCTVEVLSPFADRGMGEENDASAVIRVAFGGSSILLCADATVDTEKLLLALYPLDHLRSTVIKLGHHGSNTSSGEEFLRLVAPELALISVGENNVYDHPDREVLDRLKALKIPYISTEEAGTVQIILDGTGAEVIK